VALSFSSVEPTPPNLFSRWRERERAGGVAPLGFRVPDRTISVMSSSLKRRCLPKKVHGMTRAAAFFRSHDSRTLSSSAASAGV
jgi:hypothetical protein